MIGNLTRGSAWFFTAPHPPRQRARTETSAVLHLKAARHSLREDQGKNHTQHSDYHRAHPPPNTRDQRQLQQNFTPPAESAQPVKPAPRAAPETTPQHSSRSSQNAFHPAAHGRLKLPRDARGDFPVRLVNQFVKCGGELKPNSKLISLIGNTLSFSARCASSIRRSS